MKLPWMPFYGRDFLGSTFVRLLPREMRISYLELLWRQWDDRGLPGEPGLLGVLLGLSVEEWAVTWARIAQKFPVDTDGQRRNPRLEEIRSEVEGYREKKSVAGKKGAEARWQPDGKGHGKPDGKGHGKPDGKGHGKTWPASASASASASAFASVNGTQGEAGVPGTGSGATDREPAASPPGTIARDLQVNGHNRGDPVPIGEVVQRQVAKLGARQAYERGGRAL